MPMRLSLLLLAGLLTACGGANRHCQGEFPYQRAQTLPPPAPVEGLKWPESPSAMKVPAEPATVVPFANPVAPDAKGKEQVECLDSPPRLVVQPPAATTATP